MGLATELHDVRVADGQHLLPEADEAVGLPLQQPAEGGGLYLGQLQCAV